jgi:hypothetical protein
MPQLPQFRGSVLKSYTWQVPPQQTPLLPPGSWQGELGAAVAQLLLVSHCPKKQTSPCPQAFPQLPQFSGSLPGSLQVWEQQLPVAPASSAHCTAGPSQVGDRQMSFPLNPAPRRQTSPCGQPAVAQSRLQDPSVHAELDGQTRPQAPQFCGSLWGSVHPSEQHTPTPASPSAQRSPALPAVQAVATQLPSRQVSEPSVAPTLPAQGLLRGWPSQFSGKQP